MSARVAARRNRAAPGGARWRKPAPHLHGADTATTTATTTTPHSPLTRRQPFADTSPLPPLPRSSSALRRARPPFQRAGAGTPPRFSAPSPLRRVALLAGQWAPTRRRAPRFGAGPFWRTCRTLIAFNGRTLLFVNYWEFTRLRNNAPFLPNPPPLGLPQGSQRHHRETSNHLVLTCRTCAHVKAQPGV